MLTRAPRGTKDILPEETGKWHFIEKTAGEIAKHYGFREARFPIFEHTELFLRSVGETSDIVSKEMYTFEDRGGRSVTLRPEGTAPSARMYVEHKMYHDPQPVKFYYIGPMFRYDRPQAGRYRQFHQFGAELFGSMAPETDVELMKLALDYFHGLGLPELNLVINSVGCKKCRGTYVDKLTKYFEEKVDQLCHDCQKRFKTNPMRVLDCKEESCQKAVGETFPKITEHLCEECDHHFKDVKALLEGIQVPYQVDPHLVRGLDYYTKTAFEVILPSLGTQNALGGGGRYDYLVEECGGPSTPGVGFAVGLERILLALEQLGIDIPEDYELDVYIATIGEASRREAFKLLDVLRKHHYTAVMDYEDKSLRAQMKQANKLGAKFTLLLGEEELEKGSCQFKNMQTGEQLDLSLDHVTEKISKMME